MAIPSKPPVLRPPLRGRKSIPIGIDGRLECMGCGDVEDLFIFQINRYPINIQHVPTTGVVRFYCRKCKNITSMIFTGTSGIKFIFGSQILESEKETVEYRQYIQSPEWKVKADAAKERAGHRCQLCNKEGNNGFLHTHHRTYERLGDELPEDLIVLCKDCHAKFHDKA